MGPLISIIISTFNRSGVLRYSIKSVLRQSYTNWELIVVGDKCTDDTEAVVAAFFDPRIRFFNLPVRHGEQSQPNNIGVQHSNGELIAFLNHDDLWLEDHLKLCVRRLTESQSDLVYGLAVNVESKDRLILVNANPQHRYTPRLFVPASTWCLKRSLHTDLNGWRSASDLYNAPSQDFLFRAWKMKKRMILVPELTTVVVPSSYRKNSYIDTSEREHIEYLDRSADISVFRSTVLTHIAVTEQANYHRTFPVPYVASRLIKNAILSMIVAVGFHPFAVRNLLKFRKKGGIIEWLRIQRGLPQKESNT